MKFGDAIALVATPIARGLHMDCIDPATGQLRPDSRCAKTRDALNEGRYIDAFYERFWLSKARKRQQERNQHG